MKHSDIIDLVILFSGCIAVILFAWFQICMSWKKKYIWKIGTLVLLFLPMLSLSFYRIFSFRSCYLHKVGTFVFLVWILWFASMAFVLDVGWMIWSYCKTRKIGAPNWCRVNIISGVCVAVFTLFSLFEPYHHKIKEYDVVDSRVPEYADGYTVMHVSDIHLGTVSSSVIVDLIKTAAEKYQPDMIIHTGDLLDSKNIPDVSEQLEELAKIIPPDGKYTVQGNHDNMAGDEKFMAACRCGGFTLLGQMNNQMIAYPNSWLRLFGVDDRLSVSATSLPPEDNSKFSVFMYHLPEKPEEISLEHFQLFLAGHTHGGQIFPFSIVVNLRGKYKTGKFYDIPNQCRIYISQGTGFWGPPMRFLVRPEMTFFHFRHKNLKPAITLHSPRSRGGTRLLSNIINR